MTPSETKSEAWLAGLLEHRVALGIAATASILLLVLLVMPGGHSHRKETAVHGTPATPGPGSVGSPRPAPGPKYAIPAKPVAAATEKHTAVAAIRPITPSTPSRPARVHAPAASSRPKPPAARIEHPMSHPRPSATPKAARIAPRPPAPKPAAAKPSAKTASRPPAPTREAAGKHVFFVQVAAYRDHGSAQRHAATLLQKGWNSVVISNARGWFTVRVGPVSSRSAADKLRRRLQSKAGLKGFIVEG